MSFKHKFSYEDWKRLYETFGWSGLKIRNEHIYLAIKEFHEEMNFAICSLCKMGHVSRAAYYKWLNHKESDNDKLNQKLAERLEELHEQHPDMGYRRLNDKLYHDDKINVMDVLDLLKIQDLLQIMF